MILESMNFDYFYKQISDILHNHFTIAEKAILMEYIEVLADANFRCYKANMIVIAERKKTIVSDTLIAEMEWVARSVGEYRVASKANINHYISRVKTMKEITMPRSWMSDDIVYSIGEMMDRLSIETIKREDFAKNNRPAHMTDSSRKLSDRVEKYLIQKLEEIDKKGFYECVNEQRTYDLEGIVKELSL